MQRAIRYYLVTISHTVMVFGRRRWMDERRETADYPFPFVIAIMIYFRLGLVRDLCFRKSASRKNKINRCRGTFSILAQTQQHMWPTLVVVVVRVFNLSNLPAAPRRQLWRPDESCTVCKWQIIACCPIILYGNIRGARKRNCFLWETHR